MEIYYKKNGCFIIDRNRRSGNLLDLYTIAYLLNPHFRRHTLPMSKPSELPHQRNIKLLCAAISPTSKFMIWSQDQNCIFVAPKVLWYSSKGGSIKITSNLQFTFFRSYDAKSHFKYIGGVAVWAINSSFNRISSLSFGYSSNLQKKD